jgi:hypothetical protein
VAVGAGEDGRLRPPAAGAPDWLGTGAMATPNSSDPIITSVSGDAQGTRWPACIGIFGGCRRPLALGRHPTGRQTDATTQRARRSPRAVPSAQAPDWLSVACPTSSQPAVLSGRSSEGTDHGEAHARDRAGAVQRGSLPVNPGVDTSDSQSSMWRTVTSIGAPRSSSGSPPRRPAPIRVDPRPTTVRCAHAPRRRPS